MKDNEKERIERMERNMEFIVSHQARFAADIQQVRDAQAQFAADMQQVREVLHTHSKALVSLTGMVGRIAEAHAALAARTTDLEGKMMELAAAGIQAEDRLSAFITFVEKYISSHNGGKQ